MLRGLYQLMERKEDGGMKFIWVPLIDYVRTLIMDEAHASRVEVGDKVMLEVSSWKDVVHFGKKEMLAPRYYWTDANLLVHLEEIKVDKTLRFVEEPVEIIDRDVKSLKRSRIPIVKSIGTRSEVFTTTVSDEHKCMAINAVEQIPFVDSNTYVAYINEEGGVIESLKEDNIVNLDSEV
ncbi:hypothetical protein Tco_0783282 [Tanacetum coccineum]